MLVVAGAGTGKTRTLVERCLAWLLDEGNQGSVDEILMVTFTQAAAAEMRQRLRQGLERAPSSARLAEQLALLETAPISTLHSFCFQLVSQHCYQLGLDPKLAVLSSEESHVLARRTLDALLEDVYNSDKPADMAIQTIDPGPGRRLGPAGARTHWPFAPLRPDLARSGRMVRGPDGRIPIRRAGAMARLADGGIEELAPLLAPALARPAR